MKKIILSLLPLVLACCAGTKSAAPSSAGLSAIKKQSDGPYVLYKKDKILVKYIFEDEKKKASQVDTFMLAEKEKIRLSVETDQPGKTFSVELKDSLEIGKTNYEMPSRLVTISDIEGNFDAFRILLQRCGVIDSNYNWTFGDGHLVLVGDFVDRGSQVTEVLWLIYSLEGKAKAAGGCVHFILGNHEIMNLNGDLRYVPPKYMKNAKILRENYTDGLYGKNSELGRWLRTKNIIEKIGDLLFVHAGVSAEMNGLSPATLKRINEIARPYYTDRSNYFRDVALETIYGDLGPLWYRGYFMGNSLAPMEQVDKTLEIFNVKHIIAGHSPAGDKISVSYGGKVINVAMHHAAGHSEALLVETGKFFRVTKKGEKFLLFN